MGKFRNLFTFILISTCGLTACYNDNSHNSKYGDDSKPDTNVNGAPEITDKDYNIGAKEDKMKYGNDAANNQTKVGSGETINNNASDSITNPVTDPQAMQKANTQMSGVGESGHVPANQSAPATANPHIKPEKDTAKYKK